MRFAIAVGMLNGNAVDTFATCDFNFRMRKYAQYGPKLSLIKISNMNLLK